MSMTRTTLGTVVDFMNGGAWTQSEYADAGIPVVRVSDVHDETIHLDECKYLAPSSLEKYQKHLLLTGDVVVATVGSHPTQPGSVVGRAARVPVHANGTLLNQNAVRLRPLNEGIDRSYLRYLAVSQYFRNFIIAHARGSANQVRMAISLLKEMPICLPSIERQREIGSVLSAYDDLIENNTRRIKILEQMAQMLYREWFVDFRFPGHEKVKMVESEMGPIPEGWRVLNVGELLKFHIGGGWGEDEHDEVFSLEAHVIRGTDIPQARVGALDGCPLRYHKESNLASRRLEPWDIIFEVSGGSKGQPVGRALLVHPKILSALGGDVMCASFCKLLRVDSFKIGVCHFYQFLLDSYSNGQIEKYQVQSTGITNFKFAVFLDDAKVAMPPDGVRTRFEELCRPFTDGVFALGRKNANLRTTRDLLLPKLVSGEIEVPEVESALQGAIA
jgi:type I restriction enzyme S subunit